MTDTRTSETGIGRLLANGNFVGLWCAMLLSTAGSFLLLLALSISALERLDSALGVSGVFASQWFLALFAPAAVVWLCARWTPRAILAPVELGGAIVTLVIAATVEQPLVVLFALLLVRGYLDAITKSVRTVALRRYLEGPLLERGASLFNTSYYLGGAVGSLIGTLLVGRLSIEEIALVNVATYLGAAALYLRLGRLPASRPLPGVRRTSAYLQAFGAIRDNPLLLAAFARLSITAGIFQGFHNVARTVMPLQEFGLAPSAVTALQALASMAILSGALFVGRFLQSDSRLQLDGTFLIIATSALMMLPLVGFAPPPAFALYFVFIFAFEVAFTKFQKDLVVHCRAEDMAAVASTNHAALTLSITITVLAIGFLADVWGLFGAAAFAALAASGLGIAVFALLGRAEVRMGEAVGKESRSE